MENNEWVQTTDKLPNDLDIVEFNVLHKSGEEEILKGQYQSRRGGCFVIDGGFWFTHHTLRTISGTVTKWRYAEED